MQVGIFVRRKLNGVAFFLFINERNGFAKTSSPDIHTYILLVVLVLVSLSIFTSCAVKILRYTTHQNV